MTADDDSDLDEAGEAGEAPGGSGTVAEAGGGTVAEDVVTFGGSPPAGRCRRGNGPGRPGRSPGAEIPPMRGIATHDDATSPQITPTG